MSTFKKALALTAVAAVALSLSACSGRASEGAKDAGGATKIGIALPQKTSQNWVEAEGMFKEDCAAAKADCTIQFANGGVTEQQNQIASMITNGVKVLVIGAIDGSQLGTQLKQAHDAGIKIIAYDRLLTNTKDIDYYIAYDNFGVGVLQGQALLQGLKEKKSAGPWSVELFAGSPDDANSKKFFDGAMSILKPYIEKGELKVTSGQTSFEQCSTQGWKAENAQKRMDALLTAHYPGAAVPDGVLSPNDTLARAIITSVTQAGKPVPVVTGQDSEDESVAWVVQGKQYSTINKDTRALVKDSVQLATAVAKGEKPSIEGVTVDDKQYESMPGNAVPAYLLKPVIVTKANAEQAYASDARRLDLVKKAAASK